MVLLASYFFLKTAHYTATRVRELIVFWQGIYLSLNLFPYR
jgi:hypothetical protein